ncbi:hypothetical protein L1D34_07185 [Vibrio mediterranei]|uniref:hypothetical protein n=1 Tax=Vibrio mediterranei TaxID=689 RepID=UPI001EFD34F4|nr:hypothetical protein [Vibrio mediterranei]MCG9624622.1 hypothetical protein [Vibrio mediterranei]
MPSAVPFHSHDATMQSYFARGWCGVSQCEINTHIGKTPPTAAMAQRLAKLRRVRQCHF